MKVCPYCQSLYVPTHHRQKFCSKKCFKEHRRDYKAEWKRTKYIPKPRVGTSNINSTPNKDFDKEEKILQRELRRLGLK